MKTDEPCVLAAQQAVREAGYQGELAIANGGVDANWMVKHGIPTVTLGAGQINQHMVSEALDVKRYLAACAIGLRLATADQIALVLAGKRFAIKLLTHPRELSEMDRPQVAFPLSSQTPK